MTKEELVDLFAESVSGNRPTDDNFGLHENVLVQYLAIAYSKMINAAADADLQGMYRTLDDHLYIDKAVKLETTGNERIFVLKPTMSPIALPGQDGIRSVYPKDRPQDALDYRAMSGSKMMGDLYGELGHHSKGVYSVMPGAIYVQDYIGDCKEFDISMVAGFESIDFESEVRLPKGGQDALIGIAKSLYFETSQPDKINDGR